MHKERVIIDFNKLEPYANLMIIAHTKYGIRKVMFVINDYVFGIYKYMDCDHPQQNCLCSRYDIISWTYEDESNMEKLLFRENFYTKKIEEEKRRAEADIILASIKPTLIDKIKNIIRRIKH
ncbi:MAG TPA: hypothetical protein VK590_10495 [Saprospiraceae bacterium]|nr:hypothetical protein [Saprospiraceae bacterium]